MTVQFDSPFPLVPQHVEDAFPDILDLWHPAARPVWNHGSDIVAETWGIAAYCGMAFDSAMAWQAAKEAPVPVPYAESFWLDGLSALLRFVRAIEREFPYPSPWAPPVD